MRHRLDEDQLNEVLGAVNLARGDALHAAGQVTVAVRQATDEVAALRETVRGVKREFWQAVLAIVGLVVLEGLFRAVKRK